jgi:L-amino acid N-acyltransferase YncA
MEDTNLTFKIRQANLNDLTDIIDIFNVGAISSLGVSLKQTNLNDYFRKCIEEQDETFKIWVATDNNTVIGWQSLLPNRINPLIRPYFAESSTYVLPTIHKGVATKLLHHAMVEVKNSDLQYILGYISITNGAMIHIVEKLGWAKVGMINGNNKLFKSPELLLYVSYL